MAKQHIQFTSEPSHQENCKHKHTIPHTRRCYSDVQARRGLVRSVRGPGGGYLLARSADETRVADVILAVDEPIRATRCKSGSPKGCKANKGRCQTHELWEELGNQIYLYLASVSLADVVGRNVTGSLRVFPGKTTQIEEPSQVAAQ